MAAATLRFVTSVEAGCSSTHGGEVSVHSQLPLTILVTVRTLVYQSVEGPMRVKANDYIKEMGAGSWRKRILALAEQPAAEICGMRWDAERGALQYAGITAAKL